MSLWFWKKKCFYSFLRFLIYAVDYFRIRDFKKKCIRCDKDLVPNGALFLEYSFSSSLKKKAKTRFIFYKSGQKRREMSLIAILQQNSWECLYEAFSNKLVWIFSANLNFGVLLNGVKIPIESNVTFFLCRLFMTTWRKTRKTWKGDVSISI